MESSFMEGMWNLEGRQKNWRVSIGRRGKKTLQKCCEKRSWINLISLSYASLPSCVIVGKLLKLFNISVSSSIKLKEEYIYDVGLFQELNELTYQNLEQCLVTVISQQMLTIITLIKDLGGKNRLASFLSQNMKCLAIIL